MKRYSSDGRTLFIVFVVFIGGFSLFWTLILGPTFTDLVKWCAEAMIGLILYFSAARYTYLLLGKDNFVCRSVFYSRTIPLHTIKALRQLPSIPVPSLFVVYEDGGKEKRANIISTVFAWSTLGEFAHDLRAANTNILLDKKASELAREYERSQTKER